MDPITRTPFPPQLAGMSETVRAKLRKCLDAFVQLDLKLAYEVGRGDDIVDAAHRNVFSSIKSEIARNPTNFDDLISLLSVSRNLERMADHITNIAEDIIYLLEGRVVRHRIETDNDPDESDKV
jgi:phosphate transport system protein